MLLAYLDLYPTSGHPVRLHETAARGLTDDTVGLLGTTRPRGDVDDLPDADGGLEPVTMWLSYRTFILAGEVFAASLEAAHQEFAVVDQALRASLKEPVLMRWQLDDPTSPQLEGYVRLIGEVSPLNGFPGNVWSWSAQMRAADPRWRSQTQQSITVGSPSTTSGIPTPLQTPIPTGIDTGAATVACTNNGNEAAWPLITITGPIGGPVVENVTRGELIAFPGLTLGAGQQLVIDCDPQNDTPFTVNGSTTGVSPRWSDAVFPVISAQSTETFRFYGITGGYGAGTLMTVAWADTYI